MPVTIQRIDKGADVPSIPPPDVIAKPRRQSTVERTGEAAGGESEDEPLPFPASVEEARTIVALCARRLNRSGLLSLAVELNDAGGKIDYETLQAALKMFLEDAAGASRQGEAGRHDLDQAHDGVEAVVAAKTTRPPLANASRSRGWFAAFCAIVTLHSGVLAGVTASFFVLPFRAPGYIALPLCVLLFNLLFTPVDCPLTRLENLCRRALGWPEIRGFVKHYIVQPLRERRKRCRPQSEPTTS